MSAPYHSSSGSSSAGERIYHDSRRERSERKEPRKPIKREVVVIHHNTITRDEPLRSSSMSHNRWRWSCPRQAPHFSINCQHEGLWNTGNWIPSEGILWDRMEDYCHVYERSCCRDFIITTLEELACLSHKYLLCYYGLQGCCPTQSCPTFEVLATVPVLLH